MATQTASQVIEARLSKEKKAKLEADTKNALNRILKQNPAEVAKRMKEIQAAHAEIDRIDDSDERTARLKILNADLKSVQQINKDDEADLANVLFGAKTLLDDMGVGILDLDKPSSEELKVTADAAVRLVEANAALVKAQGSWFGTKAKVEAAEAEIKNAEQGIEDAKRQVGQMKGSRINKATLGANLQTLINMIDAATSIMRTRKEALEGVFATAVMTKDEAFVNKQQRAAEVTEYDGKIEELTKELKELEPQFEDTESGTDAYVALEHQKSTKETELQSAVLARKKALGAFNSEERRILAHTQDINTQQKQIGNQDFLITTAEIDIKTIALSMIDRLESMKSAAAEEAAKVLGQLGVEAVARNAQAMAMMASQSDSNVLEVLESQKKNVKVLTNILSASAEKEAEMVRRFGKVLEEFKNNHGIDPFAKPTGDSEGSSEGESTDSQS